MPEGTIHPLARHLLRELTNESHRVAGTTGIILFDQFVDAVIVMEHGNVEQKLEWLFKLYDLDGNGSIDKIEMLEILKVSS